MQIKAKTEDQQEQPHPDGEAINSRSFGDGGLRSHMTLPASISNKVQRVPNAGEYERRTAGAKEQVACFIFYKTNRRDAALTKGCPKHLDLMSGWTTDVGSLG